MILQQRCKCFTRLISPSFFNKLVCLQFIRLRIWKSIFVHNFIVAVASHNIAVDYANLLLARHVLFFFCMMIIKHSELVGFKYQRDK